VNLSQLKTSPSGKMILVCVGKLATWYFLRVITLTAAGGHTEWKTHREEISCPSESTEGC